MGNCNEEKGGMNFEKLFGKKSKTNKREENSPITSYEKIFREYVLLNEELEAKKKSLYEEVKSNLKIVDKNKTKNILLIKKYTDHQSYLESILSKYLGHLIFQFTHLYARELMQSNRFLLFSIISRYPKCFKKISMECIEFLENQLNYCKIGLIEIEKYIEKNKNDKFNNSQDEDYMKEL